MDDEIAIRNLLKEMMSILGHETQEVEGGEDLIVKYKESMKSENKKFDIVFMDLTIPGGMGGEQAIKELLILDPDAKVVLATGYTNNAIMANYQDHGFSARMSKPFKVDVLKKIIDEIDV